MKYVLMPRMREERGKELRKCTYDIFSPILNKYLNLKLIDYLSKPL